MSLGKKVFSSAILLFIRKLWGNAINLVVMAFLARILAKEDFGLLAVSSVFLGIISTLATSGISEYVIYYSGGDKKQKINAAFWLNLFLTIGIVLVVVVLGPLWADFFKNDKIYPLMLLLLVSFFFEMLLSIPKALLRQELEYQTLVLYGSVAMTIVSVGKLGAAYFGMGVFSLALPQAFVSPILMVAFFLKSKWRPLMYFGMSHYGQIIKYTQHLIGSRVLTKFVNEGDNIIVGKFIGLEGLGLYTLAFQLANLVTSNVIFIINDIGLPVLSKVKSEMGLIKSVYLKMTSVLCMISFPIITALVIGSNGIILVFYGPKWIDAVLPFQILCLFGLSRTINSPTSSLFNVMGRPDLVFKFGLIFAPLFLFSVYVGSYVGLIGVALATTITRVLGSFVLIGLAIKLIETRWSEIWNKLKFILFTSLATLIVFGMIFHFFAWSGFVWLELFAVPLAVYVNLLFYRILFPKHFFAFIDSVLTEMTGLKNIRVLKYVFFS